MGDERDATRPIRLTGFRLPRETILFIGGLLGVWHETVILTNVRMPVLIFFGGMMGMTVPLRADRKRGEE